MEQIYSLNNRETKAYFEFTNSLTPKQRKKGIDIIFHIGGGIGVSVSVKCGRLKKDITDYTQW